MQSAAQPQISQEEARRRLAEIRKDLKDAYDRRGKIISDIKGLEGELTQIAAERKQAIAELRKNALEMKAQIDSGKLFADFKIIDPKKVAARLLEIPELLDSTSNQFFAALRKAKDDIAERTTCQNTIQLKVEEGERSLKTILDTDANQMQAKLSAHRKTINKDFNTYVRGAKEKGLLQVPKIDHLTALLETTEKEVTDLKNTTGIDLTRYIDNRANREALTKVENDHKELMTLKERVRQRHKISTDAENKLIDIFNDKTKTQLPKFLAALAIAKQKPFDVAAMLTFLTSYNVTPTPTPVSSASSSPSSNAASPNTPPSPTSLDGKTASITKALSSSAPSSTSTTPPLSRTPSPPDQRTAASTATTKTTAASLPSVAGSFKPAAVSDSLPHAPGGPNNTASATSKLNPAAARA